MGTSSGDDFCCLLLFVIHLHSKLSRKLWKEMTLCAVCRYRQSLTLHRLRCLSTSTSKARSIQFMIIERVCWKVSTAKWRYKWRFVILERKWFIDVHYQSRRIIFIAMHICYSFLLRLFGSRRRFIYVQQLFHVLGINHDMVERSMKATTLECRLCR